MTIAVNVSESVDWEADANAQLRNNILNILKTRRGEVPFMPGLGLEGKYTGHPVSEIGPALRNDITEQLEKWMPGVEIGSISITTDASGNLNVEVEVNGT
ncbi:hypothetical protein [Oscillibacter ruminantium]|uniref:hypothetical protein n=1 Tax=Oscillibacter ruminantium TaxID=1263547 RepID=UPI00058EE6FE|nr:hypothetical protein [Oscillibacter ruminantium]